MEQLAIAVQRKETEEASKEQGELVEKLVRKLVQEKDFSSVWPGGVTLFLVDSGESDSDRLKENGGVHVRQVSSVQEKDLMEFQGVILVDFSQHDMIRLEEFCRWNQCKLFYATGVIGLSLYIFCGSSQQSEKGTQEAAGPESPVLILEPGSARPLASITAQGVATLDNNDGDFIFNEGDKVVVSALRTRGGLSSQEIKEHVLEIVQCFPKRFQVVLKGEEVDTCKKLFQRAELDSGVLERVQNYTPVTQPEATKTEGWKSFREVLLEPHQDPALISAWPGEQGEDLKQLFVALQGMHWFHQQHGFLPGVSPGDEDAAQVLELATQFVVDGQRCAGIRFEAARDVDELLCKQVAMFASYQHPILVDFLVQHVVKLAKQPRPSVFSAGAQFLLFNGFDLLDNEAKPSQVFSDASIDDLLDAKLSHLSRALIV